MSKINVNASNSKLINGRLFITGMKMHKLSPVLRESINNGSTISYPDMGKMFEYTGPFSRA